MCEHDGAVSKCNAWQTTSYPAPSQPATPAQTHLLYHERDPLDDGCGLARPRTSQHEQRRVEVGFSDGTLLGVQRRRRLQRWQLRGVLGLLLLACAQLHALQARRQRPARKV